MCLKLQEIKNPSYGKTTYVQAHGSLAVVNSDLVDKREFIQVPCGKCAECRKARIDAIIQRCIVESMFSYVFFITLTYDNNHLPCLTVNGKKYYFADYKHVQKMFKRFRLVFDRDFRYLCVNEYGDTTHRPHFHILMFVPILEGDDESTPKFLEKFIFDNLGKYFAINKGTDKDPIYEPLFTYKFGYDPIKGMTSNYFVKYIDNDDFKVFAANEGDFVQSESKVKAIRYLVGYVCKYDDYEKSLNDIIYKYKGVDDELFKKLRYKLKSQVRYSKGLGSGFIDGEKYYLPRIQARCSSNSQVYTEIVSNMPKSYDEFVDLYSDMNEQVLYWRKRNRYQYYTSFKNFKNSLTADDWVLHCLYQLYFPKEFDAIMLRYKSGKYQPTISSHFDFVNRQYHYSPTAIRTFMPNTETRIYKYLRSMVEDGIKAKVPYLAFRMDGMQTYVPLCKYYKDRVTTFDDIQHLFTVLGVKNYQEWLSLFEKSLSLRKAQTMVGNDVKYYNSDIVDCDITQNDKYNVYNKLYLSF